ncbi:MAG: hypothetical protein HQL70_08175 [Magnetococcales bacterium]|nr:hypothetical protein [Magnetococcales bacterium]
MKKKTKNSALKRVKLEAKIEKTLFEDGELEKQTELIESSEFINDGVVVEMVDSLLPSKSLEETMLYAKKKGGKKQSKAKGKKSTKKNSDPIMDKSRKAKKNKKSKKKK